VRKTHLAVGLGLKAIEHGYRVLFTTAAVLIAALTRALAEGRLDDKLKLYTMPRLLIVDERAASTCSAPPAAPRMSCASPSPPTPPTT
jgi:DNA replication protein DnaC